MPPPSIRALTFDVFGTVVDWRASVIAECEAFGQRVGASLDWPRFVDDWRYEGYVGGIGRVLRGELPHMTADELHRRKLDEMLEAHGLSGVSEDERQRLNTAWHRLDPWPDSVPGLARLRTGYVVSTLSNGNVALLVNMARHGGLTWDCILSAEITGAFKPHPQCYAKGAALLGLAPEQVLMVASHKNDLAAAQKAGLHAAFIPRPAEAGPNVTVDLTPDPSFDFVATSIEDLAAQLGC